jgi:hypothetical protein
MEINMKKLLIAFLFLASMCGAQTLTVPQVSAPSQSCFVASCSMATTYTNGSFLQASFSAELVDALGEFDVTTSVWTAAKAYPKYMVMWGGSFDSQTFLYFALYKNGALLDTGLRVSQDSDASAPDRHVYGSIILTNIAKGDTLYVKLQQSSGTRAPYKPIIFQGYELP